MGDEEIDKNLPKVVATVWKDIQAHYRIGDLEGPKKEAVLGRPARKWYTTVETPSDLVSLDVYVLYSQEGIPGIFEKTWGGITRYYRSGIAALEHGNTYEEVPRMEVEKLRPGVTIRVVAAAMESANNARTGVKQYKNDANGISELSKVISGVLDQMGIPKI
jgi:hypothetical protein